MKHVLCPAFVLLVLVNCVQAAEVPFIELKGHTKATTSATFSPDGKKVITASCDKTARIWDSETGRELQKLGRHKRDVYFAAFSPDGKKVATASSDGTARIWDTETGKELHQLRGRTPTWREWLVGEIFGVCSASFSPDGTKVVTASWDESIRIWDATTGQKLQNLQGHSGPVRFATFSPDGTKIVTSGQGQNTHSPLLVWDAESGNMLRVLDEELTHVPLLTTFSPDGKRIITANRIHSIHIWDAETGRELKKFEERAGYVIFAAFSPDGTRIVSGNANGTARILDAETGERLHELNGHTEHVNFAAFSPNGKKVVTASSDKTARIWDLSVIMDRKEANQ